MKSGFRNTLAGRVPFGTHPGDSGKTINQPSAPPVYDLLANAFQPVLRTKDTEQLSRHARITLMVRLQDLCFGQKFSHSCWKALHHRRGIFSEIRVMDECDAVVLQLRRELAQVGFHHLALNVHQRIEAENKVDRPVGDHRQAASVIDVIAQMRVSRRSAAGRSRCNARRDRRHADARSAPSDNWSIVQNPEQSPESCSPGGIRGCEAIWFRTIARLSLPTARTILRRPESIRNRAYPSITLIPTFWPIGKAKSFQRKYLTRDNRAKPSGSRT